MVLLQTAEKNTQENCHIRKVSAYQYNSRNRLCARHSQRGMGFGFFHKAGMSGPCIFFGKGIEMAVAFGSFVESKQPRNIVTLSDISSADRASSRQFVAGSDRNIGQPLLSKSMTER